MSKKAVFVPDYFRMRENAHAMQTHEAVVEMMHGRSAGYNFLDTIGYGLSNYPTEFMEYVESSDDDDDDDDDDYNDGFGGFGSQNNRYCGFSPKFLDRGMPNPLSALALGYRPAKHVTSEEAAQNAKELLDEEEKVKKKAEKKKQKKMRQRERRRLEKLEKENADKDNSKKVGPAPEKPKTTEKECEKKSKIKNNAPVPPDPGPKSLLNTDSRTGSDEEDDYSDKESVTEPEELDMNSCFVTNAAAIAKRKLEQKLKSDRKDKKEESSWKHEAKKKSTPEPQFKEKEEEGENNDLVTKSLMLATKGNEYAAAGDLDMAVKYFTDAIKHNPKEFKLFGNRSFCYEKMQQFEKALVDADIALSLSPTWIKGLYRKGKALVGLKRYYDASLIYKEVLKLDSSCADAAQELMRVQIMQLMDMGFTREQSSNALIIHGTVEKASEALSGLQAAFMPNEVASEEKWIFAERRTPKVPLGTVSQNQLGASTVRSTSQELFPIWVGDLVPEISESKMYELFQVFGPVSSVKLLQDKRCAFVNYTNKEHCEKAIREMHGYAIAGTYLAVRYPDRLHTHLGVSKAASTDTGKINKLPDECFFWRTTGCIKNNRCTYRHVPENKGIDRAKAKF